MNHVERAAAARADQELRPLRYREVAPPVLTAATIQIYRICVFGGAGELAASPAWSPAAEPLSFDQLTSVRAQLVSR